MGADTKHLLSLNGAAIFILLLSAAMYTRYPMACVLAHSRVKPTRVGTTDTMASDFPEILCNILL